MKTPATAQALEELRHDEIGAAFSIQKRPAKRSLLAQALGKERVLGRARQHERCE